MNEQLIKAIYEVRDDAAALQKKVDTIEDRSLLTPGQKEMAFRLSNGLRGWRGFNLGELASAAGIDIRKF